MLSFFENKLYQAFNNNFENNKTVLELSFYFSHKVEKKIYFFKLQVTYLRRLNSINSS